MAKRSFVLFYLLCFFAFLSNSTQAQDSSRIRISLLTCTPGAELYSTFGHSALRVTDSNSVTDHVYNYGTFDFDEPGFYLKFIRGKLRYYVSVEKFEDFKADYIFENRGMTEQVLNLSEEEKINIRHALIENLKEENKFYMYDFFLDNCTTRLRDIIVKYHQPRPQLPPVMPANYTFRNAIHQYLDSNHKDWSKFGIDILLGAPTDAVMTTEQQQFLPDNLMLAFDENRNGVLVSAKQALYPFAPQKNESSFFTPTVCFVSIFIFFLLLALIPGKFARRVLRGFDAFLFFAVGLLGIILVLMWVATDHSMTKNNYNLLWAWPMHFIYAFFINKESKRVRFYSLFTAIFLLLLLCTWFFLKQEMNNALLPLVLLLMWRSSAKAFRIKQDPTPQNMINMSGKNADIRTIQFKGSLISYSIYGKGQPVVLLHGFGEDSKIWDKQVNFLQDKFQLIVPDLSGSGASEMLSGNAIQIRDYAEAVKAILDAEKIVVCTMIGHSMGGYTALAFAEKYPDLLNRLGLFHSGAYADDEEKKETRKKAIQFIEQNGSEAFLKTSIPGLFADAERSSKDISDLISKGSRFLPASLIQYYQAMIARPDRTAVLRSFQRPVLFVIGSYDKAIPPAHSLQQSHLPSISYIHVLRHSAHMGMLEETDKANQILAQFLH